MTEAEWLAGEDPTVLVADFGGRAHARKVAVVCLRLLPSGVGTDARPALPRCASEVGGIRRRHSERPAPARRVQRGQRHILGGRAGNAPEAGRGVRGGVRGVSVRAAQSVRQRRERADRVRRDEPAAIRQMELALLRDIFGNPFRPVEFSAEWRTDTAVSLAKQMYESREFSAMPILADALQDAGCDNDDILSHCRDAKQPHVRGCWVADLVLGK